VGLFGVVICWLERRRLQFLAMVEPGLDSARVAPAGSVIHPGRGQAYESDAEEADEAAATETERPERPEDVDRVLARISRVGINGLTRSERAILKRATERSRETSE
jgi:hypothetical protein